MAVVKLHERQNIKREKNSILNLASWCCLFAGGFACCASWSLFEISSNFLSKKTFNKKIPVFIAAALRIERCRVGKETNIGYKLSSFWSLDGGRKLCKIHPAEWKALFKFITLKIRESRAKKLKKFCERNRKKMLKSWNEKLIYEENEKTFNW